MNKELYVSSTPHETKVALVEDDQLSEVYFERENEYTLAGSIYKGRVTRVLPGMQSAFVDIGLERDAFLYVSDFLDLAGEDDDEFGDVQVGTQFAEVKQSSDVQPSGIAEAVESAEPAETEPTVTGAEATQAGDAEPATEGARPWRGRRRRRGRRGGREHEPPASGVPAEASTAKAEEAPELEELEPETPAAVQEEQSLPAASAVDKEPVNYQGMPTDYAPMVLPGESIARYTHGAETEPRQERPIESRPDARPRRDDFRGGRGRDRDRGGRDRERPREPQEDFSPPPDYTPIVLPGESISKYRNVEMGEIDAGAVQSRASEGQVSEPAHAGAPGAGVLPEHQPDPSAARHNATPAIEPMVQRHTPEAPPPAQAGPIAPVRDSEVSEAAHAGVPDADGISDEDWEHYSEPREGESGPAGGLSDEDLEHYSEPREGGTDSSVTPGPAAVDDIATTDRIRVPEFLESDPKTPPEAPATKSTDSSEATFASRRPWHPNAAREAGSAHQAGSYSPEGGPVVHEEIDEEETDMPSYVEHLNAFRHQETEEQVHDRSRNVELFGEAVRETDEEQAIEESEYEFDPEAEDEFEESEMLSATGQEEEEGDEPEALTDDGRAELRASAATAGYQQRTERVPSERPMRDRRGRRGQPMRARREAPRHVPLISELLKEGQEVLIQIAKEPIGKKGARITSHIALPGRFLVYMPTVNHIGVSRKISSEEERQRLKRIVASERENGHGGFIVRTAAAAIEENELRADIRFLKHLWTEIRNRADSSKSPALIYHDLNLVERILRDQVTQDFSQIWVDTEQEYERVVRFASRFQPNLVRRIKLYTKPVPLFEQFGVQEEINKALKSKVWLKSGGYIVINQTEALVAIDINTGKYVGKTARLEDTIVKTNCDAVKEIVRQIRLRDLGGIIVIDFIDMDERRNRQKVMQALEEALKSDRAPSKVLQFNDFGLVAITRKRVKQSLERTLGTPCPYCEATGFVKSVTTVCNEIWVEMRKIRKHVEAHDVTLRVNPEVAKELKSNNGRWLSEMEDLLGRPILIKSDTLLHQEQFDIQF